MSLPNEILNRIQEGKKLNPDAPKRIIYFVGPSACGKTTKIKKLENSFGGFYQYITLEGFASMLLKHPNIFIRSLFYLQALWERLINAIQNTETTNQNTIFMDGHPILSVFQCEAFYRLYEGRVITEKQFSQVKSIYEDIVEYIKTNEYFKDFKHIIYYINIPLEVNLKLLQNKQPGEEITKDMKDELESLRKIIHSGIFDLADQFNDTKVIEVNSLSGLEIINMYLLGSSGCD
jgi:ABC-type multidrug transport system ATPase subunit